MHYINGWCRIVVAVSSPMRVDARSCMNVFGTRDSKYYRRQSLWDEWRRVSHFPANWWAFLSTLQHLAKTYSRSSNKRLKFVLEITANKLCEIGDLGADMLVQQMVEFGETLRVQTPKCSNVIIGQQTNIDGSRLLSLTIENPPMTFQYQPITFSNLFVYCSHSTFGCNCFLLSNYC